MHPKKRHISIHKYSQEKTDWEEQPLASSYNHSHHSQRNSLYNDTSNAIISSTNHLLSSSQLLATCNSAPSLPLSASIGGQRTPPVSPLSLFTSSLSASNSSTHLSSNFETTRLKILTYNIWFSPYYMKERSLELVSILEREQIDVVCLQEVTQTALDILKSQKFVQQNYLVTFLDSNSWSDYGVIVLSRVTTVNDVCFYTLPTTMDRNLLVLDLLVNGEKFVVSNVHLESLDSSATRKRQLNIISQILSSYKENTTVLLMGDFNFDSEQNYKESTSPLENDTMIEILSNYQDLWASLHYSNGMPPEPPLSDGKTFDTQVNLMLRSQKPERMRYDRVMMRNVLGVKKKWVAVDCSLVGTEPFLLDDDKQCFVLPSDHFGLLAELEYKDFNLLWDD